MDLLKILVDMGWPLDSLAGIVTHRMFHKFSTYMQFCLNNGVDMGKED